MEKIDKLPFYDNYMLLVEKKRVAEKEIIELKNPEKQLERIKKFYQNIGADYSKNQWLMEKEENISATNRGEDSRMSQLKGDVRLGTIVESAVEKQDNESLKALSAYRGNEMYCNLVKQIMYYVGICKVKSDSEFIKKAGEAIVRDYKPTEAKKFADEGVHYYIFYLRCLQTRLKSYRNDPQNELVKENVSERCTTFRLMLNRYTDDPYIGEEVRLILAEISDVEVLLSTMQKD